MNTEQKIKDVSLWTKSEFMALPFRSDFNSDEGDLDYIIIMPLKRVHESGYRLIDFIAGTNKDGPICRLSGCSDVINFDGIGGYGYKWLEKYGTVPAAIPAKSWSMDCLKVSGFLRVFASGKLKAGAALSSFEIFSTETPR